MRCSKPLHIFLAAANLQQVQSLSKMSQPSEDMPPYMRITEFRHMSMPALHAPDEMDDHTRKTKQSIIDKNALLRPAVPVKNIDIHHDWMVELKELRDRAIFLMTKECILRDECEVSFQVSPWVGSPC